MKRLSLIVLLSLIFPVASFSQDKLRNQRLKITREILDAFRKDALTNEQVMKKYVIEGAYFKNDSVKKAADYIMDLYRDALKRPDKQDIYIFKYLDREEEFAVTGIRSIGDTSTATIKMKFSLWKSKIESVSVDTNDIYAIKAVIRTEHKTPDGPKFIDDNVSMLLLFDKTNKIVSFFPWTTGNYTLFLKF